MKKIKPRKTYTHLEEETEIPTQNIKEIANSLKRKFDSESRNWWKSLKRQSSGCPNNQKGAEKNPKICP
jgi:hypothetical protein